MYSSCNLLAWIYRKWFVYRFTVVQIRSMTDSLKIIFLKEGTEHEIDEIKAEKKPAQIRNNC